MVLSVSNVNSLNDHELMARLAKDDLDAWSELVNRHSKLVYSISFQILKNNNDTEDSVQNTFINLKRYSSGFDETRQLVPWLSTIAGNDALAIYKKRKSIRKREIMGSDSENHSFQSLKKDASEVVAQKEVDLLVKKAIEQLPETSRIALTLYYLSGMTQTDIANELGVSQKSISEKIKDSLDNVKAYLKKAGVHASFLLSPELIKEGIFINSPPKELIVNIIKHMPTEAQIAQLAVAKVSGKIGFAALKMKSMLILNVLLISTIGVTGYLFWPKKIEAQVAQTLEVKEKAPKLKLTVVSNIFNPIDFSKFKSFDFKLNQKEEILSIDYVIPDKWKATRNSNGLYQVKSLANDNSSKGGLIINSLYTENNLFKGSIKLKSTRNDLFGRVGINGIQLVSLILKMIHRKINLHINSLIL